MASPQTANGYTRLANELVRAIFRFPFSGTELRLLLWVIRDSYGWNRKETQVLTVSALSETTLVPRATVSWALIMLVERGVIMRATNGGYRLNKNYDEWIVKGTDMLPLTSNPLDVQSIGGNANPLDKKAPTIRNLKTSKNNVGRSASFAHPTMAEIKAYCLERRNTIDAEKFFHHYEANGWMVGKVPMKNWKSTVCYWERTTFDTKGKMAATGKPCPLCEVGVLPYPNAIVCEKCGARCRACNKPTARLKIVTRRDKTKTAVCDDTGRELAAAAIPTATKTADAERVARFMAEHNRKKIRKETT